MTKPIRVFLLAPIVAMAATAHAGSIDVLRSDRTDRSIDYVTCARCAPLKSTANQEEPDITLEPGTQRVEIRKVNGVLKVFRTEAWLGGSPVTYVSKASTDLIDPKTAEALARESAPNPDSIDTATTSAVDADLSSTAPAVKPELAQAPAGKQMEQIRIRVEKSATPQTADMSDGATATVDGLAKHHSFDAGKLQLRLSN
jgi:hypothetical protein